jgi:hypothetical protein
MIITSQEYASYEIPERIPPTANKQQSFSLRKQYIQEGMFAFVSYKWLRPFCEWVSNRKCLEVMAGRGILSLGLRSLNTSVIATDDFSWAIGNCSTWKHTVTEVINLSAIESIERYGSEIDILIMSWPPPKDTIAFECIKKLYQVNQNAIVCYIGEKPGGCTAESTFFKHFKRVFDPKFKLAQNNYECWEGIKDQLYLGIYSETEVKWGIY